MGSCGISPLTSSLSVLLATPASCSPRGSRRAHRLRTRCSSPLQRFSSAASAASTTSLSTSYKAFPGGPYSTLHTSGIFPSSISLHRITLTYYVFYLVICLLAISPLCQKISSTRTEAVFSSALCPVPRMQADVWHGMDTPLPFVSESRSVGRGATLTSWPPGFLNQLYFTERNGGPF